MEMVFFNNLLVAGIMMCLVFAEADDLKNEEKVKRLFVKMLGGILDVNEKRLNALKKITKLQDFVMAKSQLPRFHKFESYDFGDSSKETAILSVFDILNKNVTFRRTNKLRDQKQANKDTSKQPIGLDTVENSEEKVKVKKVVKNKDVIDVTVADGERKLDVNIDGIRFNIALEDYRKSSWRNSCNRKAYRVCKTACKNAHKNFCTTYKCSRRAKRRFKQECRRSCKAKFMSDRYSDTE